MDTKEKQNRNILEVIYNHKLEPNHANESLMNKESYEDYDLENLQEEDNVRNDYDPNEDDKITNDDEDDFLNSDYPDDEDDEDTDDEDLEEEAEDSVNQPVPDFNETEEFIEDPDFDDIPDEDDDFIEEEGEKEDY